MNDVVRYAREGGIAVLTADNPPVNALGHPVRAGLKVGLERAIAEPEVQAIVILCAGRTFFAGADITEFGKPPKSPSLREVHEVMDSSPKPIVAGIHGTALGGGLETALACHYRVAVSSAKLGLPEVKLGILPGAGGTQRLPRLVGIEKAIEMICSGEPIEARQARELGLLCAVVEEDLAETTVAFARQVVEEERPLVRVRDQDHLIHEAARRQEVFQSAREHYARTKRGMMAPQHCIAAVQATTEMDFEAGMKRERELFEELVASDQSKALRHMFFAEREAAKIPDVPRDTPRREVDRVAVLGAGTMGTGIAMTFANAGFPVTLIDADEAALERGMGNINRHYDQSARKGRLSPEEATTRIGLIAPTTDSGAAAEADLVIEAVFEDMELKKKIFGELGKTAKEGAILATNTSTLDVNAIAKSGKRAGDVVGLHFFSPAHVMKLLEVVRGDRTEKDVLATCFALARRVGKVPVLAGVCHGFIGNRMLHAYFDQAFRLLYEGALPHQVDKALYDFGLAMGPFQMSDLAGLDVSWRIRQSQGEEEPIADRLCEMGRFGQKTGAGYYRYRNGSRTPLPDETVTKIVEEEGRKRHGERRKIGSEEIVERCLLALVNEGARILEEGIALRASDIDVVYVYGYGFPAWRGGPMFWADQQGLGTVRDKLAACFEADRGEVLKPAALVEKLAGEGRGFADLDKGDGG